MTLLKTRVTVDEFDNFTQLPENDDKRFELIEGEIVEITSNSYSSILAGFFLTFINLYNLQNNLGWVTGADGGYQVGTERYLPDVGFISKARQPTRPRVTYIPLAPDLAVEVVSPTDSERQLTIKIFNYVAAGTTVWVAYPDEQTVVIFAPNQPPIRLDRTGVIDGGAILPGFALTLTEIFRDHSPQV